MDGMGGRVVIEVGVKGDGGVKGWGSDGGLGGVWIERMMEGGFGGGWECCS